MPHERGTIFNFNDRRRGRLHAFRAAVRNIERLKAGFNKPPPTYEPLTVCLVQEGCHRRYGIPVASEQGVRPGGINMNFAHMHLMFNHLPVLGVAFGVVVLLASFVFRKKEVMVVGLVTLILAGLTAIPVYLTGEPAEEALERFAGNGEALINTHESAAMVSLGLAIASAIFAAAVLAFSKTLSPRLPGALLILTTFVGLLTATSMAWTANLGGEIRHTEIRQGSAVFPQNGSTQQPATRKDDDD